MNLSRYGYVVGLLIVLGLFASVLFSVRTSLSSKDIKTYINTKHGFSFDYPTSFDLLPPSDEPAALDDETLSAEEREIVYQKYETERLKEITDINGGLLKLGEGRDYREIDVSVMDPMEFPTLEEEKERCERENALVQKLSNENPEGPYEGPFGCPDEKEGVLRDALLAEQKSIAELPIGTHIVRTQDDLDDGEIIEINGIRGLKGMTFGSGSGAYRASFVTYNAVGERIDLDINLFLNSSEYPEVISSDDVSFRQKAETDPRAKALDDIISSFKLL